MLGNSAMGDMSIARSWMIIRQGSGRLCEIRRDGMVGPCQNTVETEGFVATLCNTDGWHCSARSGFD